MEEYITHSRDETVALGRRLAAELTPGSLIAFTGGLGAGKTAFCQGIAEGLGCTDPVSSPTFAIVNYYRGPRPFAHFDLYRIHTEPDLSAAGFYDYLDMGAVVAAEWSENCADLLPDYFNFVRGVVESPDLSLNISRELLQHDRQLKVIAGNLEKKIKAELERMLRDDREKYETFYRSFGRQLKLCALDNYGARKEQLQDLLLFYSSTEKKPVTLAEYVSRMQPEQKFIYFASGDTVDAIDHMPQTELLKDHNMEILYFTDKADEFLPDMLQKYQDKPFRSAIDGDLELGDEQKPDETDSHQESFAFLKEALGDKVDQVKASTRLKTHPVCLSSGQGITFEMEKYFTAVQPELGMKAKRILEINVDHPAFAAFETARITDPDKAKKYAQILYNQACLIAGLPIENPSAYTDLICSLWK